MEPTKPVILIYTFVLPAAPGAPEVGTDGNVPSHQTTLADPAEPGP